MRKMCYYVYIDGHFQFAHEHLEKCLSFADEHSDGHEVRIDKLLDKGRDTVVLIKNLGKFSEKGGLNDTNTL
jgi:hypothetical protein